MESLGIAMFVICAALGVGTLVRRVFFTAAARAARTLRSARSVAIRDAPDGAPVKVQGVVTYVGRPMEAPLSGRPCALWEVLIEEQGGRQQKGWCTVIHDYECSPFLVDDGTGKALVNAVIPRLALVQDARFQSMTFTDATERLEAFLASRGQQSTGLLRFNRTLRYLEGVIESGERVAVLGVGRWEADSDGSVPGGYREAPRRLVLEDPDGGNLVISDDPSTLR